MHELAKTSVVAVASRYHDHQGITMSRKQFEGVSCKYGAPMGRPEIIKPFA